jgi:hypothetical protein
VLAEAGYRVASADLRGRGESSLGWTSITRTDVAGDLLALIGHLDRPAVIVGHSLSRGRPPSPRRSSRNWSTGSSRSTRSPGQKPNVGALLTETGPVYVGIADVHPRAHGPCASCTLPGDL